ncbi:MAG TPA: hypothetical protein DEB39_03160 [Planctomycetaceae bacterium]|nr:hypothetical protein [Planctomycetaceae bacterium]
MNVFPFFAYLDPGTLTFLMQCLVGVIVGGALSMRMFWTGIKIRVASLFGFRGKSSQTPQTSQHGDEARETLSFPQENDSNENRRAA